MTARYEIKSDYLGPARHHKQEIRVLNRTLRWSARALQCEPDQRHAELIVKEMGMEGAKPAVTPGTAETKEETKAYDKSPELSRRDAAVFRGLAARLNYLSLDRPDLQFSAKEVAKKISKPREADWAKLKRVAKYIVGAQGWCSNSIGKTYHRICTPTRIQIGLAIERVANPLLVEQSLGAGTR